MSVRWEGLAGDTGTFALKLALARDPDVGIGASLEEAASWGAFELWVDGENLCRHEESGELVDSVHWYTLPLIEWLVASWDALFHEEKPAVPTERGASAADLMWITRFPKPALSPTAAAAWERRWSEWWARHCLLGGRAGGPFPNVFIRRLRDDLEISWRRARPAGVPQDFRFIHSSGRALLDPASTAEAIHEVIGGALNQIKKLCGGDSNRLQKLSASHAALRRTDPTRRVAWLAGLGEQANDYNGEWRNLSKRFAGLGSPEAIDASLSPAAVSDLVVEGSAHAALMYGSVSPTISGEDATELARHLLAAFSDGEPEQFLVFTDSVSKPAGDDEPWSEAYALAEEVLECLHLPAAADDSIDIDEILGRLGVNVHRIHLSDRQVRGVALAGPRHTPSILINANYPAHRLEEVVRFTKAHELCHLIVDRGWGRKLAIVSGPWAPAEIEKRANAFAASLLMPAKLLRKHLGSRVEPIDADAVDRLARRLGTSGEATAYHLRNTGIFDGDAALLSFEVAQRRRSKDSNSGGV